MTNALFTFVLATAVPPSYNEAPQLATLVAAGKLPPVEQRLPKEPLVAEWSTPDGKIGRYGGVLRRATWDPGFAVPIQVTPLLMAKHTYTNGVYPNVAKSYQMKDGGKQWIIHLREGLKWSDGHPFTVDDILFWYQDMQLNRDVSPVLLPSLQVAGEVVRFEKLDDHALRITTKVPYMLESSVRLLWFTTRYPRHYLSQFHAAYVGREQANRLAKDLGFASWPLMLLEMADPYERVNADKPSLEPWVLSRAPPDNPVIFRRNPYYWAVDKVGNQLPYIDEMRWDIVGDPEVVKLKALAGELDYRTIQDISAYPLFKKSETQGRIKVFRWASTAINALQVEFNLTHKDLLLRQIFADKRFRFAVSHALNRQMINELVWLGMAEPWQVAPYEQSRFYNPALARAALSYDPAKANKLLDAVGLGRKDSGGWRLRPDGQPLRITFIAFPEASLSQIGEIIMDNLQAVGLNVNLRIIDMGYMGEQRKTNAYDAALIAHSWGTSDGIFLTGGANHFVPVRQVCFWAPEWVNWYQSRGNKGIEPSAVMLRAIDAYEKARSTLDSQEQKKWFKVVTDIAAENLWTIGTTKYPGHIKVINPRLRNLPQTFLPWHRGDFGRPDLWFYEWPSP